MMVGASKNMGLRKKIGWEQYANLMLVFYSCEWMIKHKLNPDPRKPPRIVWEQYYSNAGKDWPDVKDKSQFWITLEDSELMAYEVTLPSIELVIELIANGSLPSVNKAKEHIRHPCQVLFDLFFAHNVSVRHSVKLDTYVSHDVGVVEVISEEEVVNINDLDDSYQEGEEDNKPYPRSNMPFTLFCSFILSFLDIC